MGASGFPNRNRVVSNTYDIIGGQRGWRPESEPGGERQGVSIEVLGGAARGVHSRIRVVSEKFCGWEFTGTY